MSNDVSYNTVYYIKSNEGIYCSYIILQFMYDIKPDAELLSGILSKRFASCYYFNFYNYFFSVI